MGSENGKMLEEPPVRRRAMTLTELIVVMAIMMILVSAIVVAVFQISSKAPVKGTQGLLQQLAVGLEAYRATYRMYPECPPVHPSLNMYTNDPTYVISSSATLWQSLEFDGKFVSVGNQYKTEITAYDVTITPYFVGAFIDARTQHWSSYNYQDAWKQPLLYLCSAPYTQYTLTSAGPDTILGTADDIVVP